MKDIYDLADGDDCPNPLCNGVLDLTKSENCSCHLGHAPCSSCESIHVECPECYWKPEDGPPETEEEIASRTYDEVMEMFN